MARTAHQAEQQALTTTALALAVLATALLPTPAPVALVAGVLVQYAALALAGGALRLDLPQLLAGHHQTLRAITAGTLLTLAAALHTLTTITTQALATTAHRIAPKPPSRP